MPRNRRRPTGCVVPPEGGKCLPECQNSGVCRAQALRYRDGRTLMGRPLGFLGRTLRFLSLTRPEGPVLVPFAEVEPLSLYEALRSCTDPGDGPALLALAEVCAERGLVEIALRELDRVTTACPAMQGEVRGRRALIFEDAARRGLADARDHVAANRGDHARAALDEVMERFPDTKAASEARELRRTLAGDSRAAMASLDSEDRGAQR